MMILFGTRALLEAHERNCMEDRAITRKMFEDVKKSIEAVEYRQNEAATHLAQSLEELRMAVSQITVRVAWIMGAVAAATLLITHLHLLDKI